MASTARNVLRLILGSADLLSLAASNYCENSNNEFCKAYKEYEFYINLGLLSSSVLNNVFPDLYKRLKNSYKELPLSSQERKLLNDIFEESSELGVTYGDNLVAGISKSKLLAKLDNFPDAKRFVSSLDELADAGLLKKIDNLSSTQLENLNIFYKNIPSPSGFTTSDYNFTATKTIDGQQVSITYKHGFPNFHNTPYCPTMNYPNRTTGKFKFESNSLAGSSNDFKQANEALLGEFGFTITSPKTNGYYQSGNYRWNGKSTQFELQNASGGWDKYTWHHFEDGKTMFPVLSDVHTASAGAGGFVHSGGNKIIESGIKGIFEFTGF